MLCAYTRPRYQVSAYRTIGPLVFHLLLFTICMKFQMNLQFCQIRPLTAELAALESLKKTSVDIHVLLSQCISGQLANRKRQLTVHP